MPGTPPILGAGVGLPGTPQENVIRQRAQAEKMKKFDRDATAQGLVEDPEASTRSEEEYNARNFGFDPAPDQLTYKGNPAFPLPGFGVLPPIQPGAVDPQTGARQFPELHPIFNPHGAPPTPPVVGEWGDPILNPYDNPQHDARLENWERHQRERERRGGEPATKVWSAPIGPLGPPRPPLPQG